MNLGGGDTGSVAYRFVARTEAFVSSTFFFNCSISYSLYCSYPFLCWWWVSWVNFNGLGGGGV